METIEWNNNFSVGIDIIDEQHRTLIDLTNDLIIALSENKEKLTLSVFLEALLDYSIYHFDAEEDYASETNSPSLAEHKLMHKAFSDKILEYKARLEMDDQSTAKELLEYLKKWLVEHIQKADRELFDC